MTRTTLVLMGFLHCAFCFSWHLILESLTSAELTDFKIFLMFSWGWQVDYVTGGLERHLTPGTNQTSSPTGKKEGEKKGWGKRGKRTYFHYNIAISDHMFQLPI